MNRKPVFDAIRLVIAARLGVPVDRVKYSRAEVDGIDAGIDAGLLQVEPVTVTEPPASDRDAMTVPGERRLSAAGTEFLHGSESLRLTTYRDPGSKNGLPITGGWGSTRDHLGKPFKLGFTAPKEYWDALYAAQIREYEQAVDRLCGNTPTTQRQFDAMVSLCYNIGVGSTNPLKKGGFTRSTVLRMHRAGAFKDAARAFLMWNKQDGAVMRGLTSRRLAESLIYLPRWNEPAE